MINAPSTADARNAAQQLRNHARTYRILLIFFLGAAGLHAQDRLTLDLEEGKSGAVWNLALDADGRTLYSCGRDSSAKSWDLATGEAIRMFRPAHPTLITSLALDQGGDRLALGDMNGHLTVWNARTGVQYYDIPAHDQYVTSVAVTRDGSGVITAGRDGRIRAWKLDDGSPRWSSEPADLWISAVAVSPDGATVASAGQDGSVRLLRAKDGGGVAVLGRHNRFCRALLFSADGKYLFSAGAGGDIRAWDLQSLALFRVVDLDEGYAHGLALDRMGELLLVGKMNDVIELWDWKRRMRKSKLSADSYGTMSALFSSNAERIYSAHTSGAVKVWNNEDGSLLLNMVGFSDGQWLSFTPDGYYDCSAFGDRYVRWRRGEALFPLERYSELYHRPSIIEDVLRGGYKPGGAFEPSSIRPSPGCSHPATVSSSHSEASRRRSSSRSSRRMSRASRMSPCCSTAGRSLPSSCWNGPSSSAATRACAYGAVCGCFREKTASKPLRSTPRACAVRKPMPM